MDIFYIHRFIRQDQCYMIRMQAGLFHHSTNQFSHRFRRGHTPFTQKMLRHRCRRRLEHMIFPDESKLQLIMPDIDSQNLFRHHPTPFPDTIRYFPPSARRYLSSQFSDITVCFLQDVHCVILSLSIPAIPCTSGSAALRTEALPQPQRRSMVRRGMLFPCRRA